MTMHFKTIAASVLALSIAAPIAGPAMAQSVSEQMAKPNQASPITIYDVNKGKQEEKVERREERREDRAQFRQDQRRDRKEEIGDAREERRDVRDRGERRAATAERRGNDGKAERIEERTDARVQRLKKDAKPGVASN